MYKNNLTHHGHQTYTNILIIQKKYTVVKSGNSAGIYIYSYKFKWLGNPKPITGTYGTYYSILIISHLVIQFSVISYLWPVHVGLWAIIKRLWMHIDFNNFKVHYRIGEVQFIHDLVPVCNVKRYLYLYYWITVVHFIITWRAFFYV